MDNSFFMVSGDRFCIDWGNLRKNMGDLVMGFSKKSNCWILKLTPNTKRSFNIFIANSPIAMKHQEMNLNIKFDAPDEVWNKVPVIYAQLEGWLGYGKGGENGEQGIPYWFNFNEDEKHISASVEPAGLHFSGLMNAEEWELWVKAIKEIATRELGYKVGEIELGKVDF